MYTALHLDIGPERFLKYPDRTPMGCEAKVRADMNVNTLQRLYSAIPGWSRLLYYSSSFCLQKICSSRWHGGNSLCFKCRRCIDLICTNMSPRELENQRWMEFAYLRSESVYNLWPIGKKGRPWRNRVKIRIVYISHYKQINKTN